MIGGFALIAYPAEYDNSGVKTFIVNQDGVVYEKDLDSIRPASLRASRPSTPTRAGEKVVNNGLPPSKREAPARSNEGDPPAKPNAGEAQAKP